MNFPPMTQNQKLILSFLASTAAGAASAGIAAVVQSYTQQGLNIPVLINVALVAFGAFFGPALYNFVPGHIQQILAAANDTTSMLQQNLQQAQQSHAALTQTVQTLAQVAQKQAVAAAQPPAQPVTNNNWMLDKPTNTTTAVQPPLQGGVVQVPFPPAQQSPAFLGMRPMGSVNMAQTPVDTSYQGVPSDLHFGDTGLIPQVGQ